MAHSDTDPYITIDAKGCDIPIWVPEDFHRDVKFAGNKCILTGDPAHLENWRKRRQRFGGPSFSLPLRGDFIWKMMPRWIEAYGVAKTARTSWLPPQSDGVLRDGLNDLPMIEYAGFGVAMANAPEQLKEKRIMLHRPVTKMDWWM